MCGIDRAREVMFRSYGKLETMSRIRGGDERACKALQGAIRFPASLSIGCREIAQAATHVG